MLNRRAFLQTAAGGCLAGIPVAPAAARPPNFVIVLCDDLGYGDLGCFGSPVIQTPHLDRFAGEGMRFTDCYAAAPVCSPSRTGMLTGRIPDRAGVYNWIPENNVMHLRREEVTFARLLRSAGYATCHSGKWHCNGKFNSPEQPQPGDHGFDHWFSTQNNAAPSHANPVNFVRNGTRVGPTKGYSSTLIVEEAIGWMKGLPAQKPFCLFVCFHAPHEPVAAAEEFVRMYPKAAKRGEALYYADVTQMDYEFGRLMKHLDETRLRDNTLVFFTSDNGPETLDRYPGAWRSHGSPGPLRSMKLSMYEGGSRVPGMLRWPGRTRPGLTSAEPVSGVDMLPTLCEIAGVRLPADRRLDGTSIVPALEGKSIRRRVPLQWRYYNAIDRPRVALRAGDWKILGIPDQLSPRGTGSTFVPKDCMPYIKDARLVEFELYHLREDVGEKNNLADREPRRLKQLTERLIQLDREIRAEGPDWRTAG